MKSPPKNRALHVPKVDPPMSNYCAYKFLKVRKS